MTIMFTVPGVPVGKARARVTKSGHAYTPKKTRDYETLVGEAFIDALKTDPIKKHLDYPLFGKGIPVGMILHIYMPVPKNTSKRDVDKYAKEQVYHVKKPDVTNIIKAIEDAVNGLAYADDSQIAFLRVAKVYSATPRVVVAIKQAQIYDLA